MLCGALAGLSKFLIVGFSRTANAVAASVSALAERLQHVCAGKSALMVGEAEGVTHRLTGSPAHSRGSLALCDSGRRKLTAHFCCKAVSWLG